MADGLPLSIGEVLSVLQEEFPDVTISKIRFLEGQGLVRPERNASGYRQFSDDDVERLTWILRQQRDHFLPLKVIKKALDRGGDLPDAGDGAQPTLWSAMADEAVAAEAAAARQAADEADEPDEGRDRPRDPQPAVRRHPADGSLGRKPKGNVVDDEVPDEAGAGKKNRPGKPAKEPSGDAADRARRRHNTPADVVAALQEDPRSPQRPAGSSAAGRARDELAAPAEPVLATDAESELRMTRAELLDATGLTGEMLDGLEQFGLVEAESHAGEPAYDGLALRVAVAAARYAELGVEPRHLRIYKVSAEREAGFIEQLVMPLLKQRNPASKARAVESAAELARLGAQVHAAVLARELGPGLAP